MGEKYVRTHCFRAEDDDDIVTRVDDVTEKRGRSGESHGNQVSDSLQSWTLLLDTEAELAPPGGWRSGGHGGGSGHLSSRGGQD